jgi:hypothetical protein
VSTGVLLGFWLPAGVRDWRLLLSLIAAVSVASGRAGQGPGGARPPGAAPEASLRWPGGSPMIGRRETGSRDRAGCIRLFRSVPWWGSRGAGSAAGCSHPFACPGGGAGAAWGGSASERGGQAGSIKRAPAPPGEGGGADTRGDLAPGRWPAGAVHAARAGGWVSGGLAGGLGRLRICPSRMP